VRTQPDSIIRNLENHNSRLDKEAILEVAVNEGLSEFFEGVRMALDPLVTFGIKQVPAKDCNNGQGLAWPVFVDLAEKLRNRKLTGHAARDAVALAMDIATQSQWNHWYRRILIKDLKCGVSEKTVNKVVQKMKQPDLSVPVFACMLAHDSANHEKKMTGVKQCELKLDGVRTLTVIHDVHGEHIEMFSRNGKQFHNFDHVIEEIRSVLKHNPAAYPMVLDGEIMSASFQDLMRQVHRKENVAAQDAVLYLFDVIALDSFVAGTWNKPQHERSALVHAWVKQHQQHLTSVRALHWETVDLDTEAGQLRYTEINKSAIAGGYEGLLVKDPLAPYECKRSHSWLKTKPFIEVTLEVIGIEQGTGRNEQRLGALVCAGVDDGRDITVNVGSGFSDDQRSSIWAAGDAVLGQLVEVRADAVTQNQDGTYSLRFPRFKTFRGFKPGEKL
jgi:DNA ligase 1